MWPFLSAATRQAFESSMPVTLRTDNWRNLAESHGKTTVSGRVEKLLRAMAKRSGRPGHNAVIDVDNDYPLADCADTTELVWCVEYLIEERLVLQQRKTATGNAVLMLTVKGWQAIEPRSVPYGIPGRCFVAMWFDDSMSAAYTEGFEPGIEDAGFQAKRIDQNLEVTGISDDILAEIRMSQFTVADFTGQRHGVYYEAGFARALGRTVILCCRKDAVDDLHFDVKHLRHIVWETPTDLRKQLTASIRANIIQPA